jgi:hypothetical protein
MTVREQDFFVIPGRLEEANPESPLQTNLGIPGPARRAVPGMTG